jgi:hypothetical protein
MEFKFLEDNNLYVNYLQRWWCSYLQSKRRLTS